MIIATCSPPEISATSLLKEEAMQDSVMTVISNDPHLMSKMMTHMMHSPDGMNLLMHNEEWVNGMMSVADKDSTLCRSVVTNMMNHHNLNEMVQHLQESEMMGRVTR